MNAANILVVDDEPQIRRVLRSTLTSQGYVLTDAKTGEEAIEIARKAKPDLILLDVNMPGMGGVETCREIRRFSSAPIIMLTVRNAERDKVLALDAGADDYVVKPFGIEELLARVRASLRRYSTGETLPPFSVKDISMDFETRRVEVRGAEVHLTPKEFDVMKHLVMNQGKPLTHRRLLQAVWGPDYGEETENLRVVINQLRKKIEADPTAPKIYPDRTVGRLPFPAPEDSPSQILATVPRRRCLPCGGRSSAPCFCLGICSRRFLKRALLTGDRCSGFGAPPCEIRVPSA
jgi:two-component system, OmpR family, KDP operon response regulator KdpE